MKKGWKYYVGICFFVYSLIPMTAMLVLPFLGLPLAEAGAFALAFVATGEISFWIAAALLGKEIITAIKKRVFAIFKRTAPVKPVSRFRHRFGITLILISFLPYYAMLIYLLFFRHIESLTVTLTWVMVGGELLCYIAFFILGAQFWERFKKLFYWSGNAIQQEGSSL